MSNRLTTLRDAVCECCGEVLPPAHSLKVCPKCLLQGAAVPPSGAAERGERSTPGEAMEELSELLPDFEWLGVIGRGGMGAVYKARQKRLDRVVAVKVLSEEISVESRFASRFEREAKILARLNHPHIVTIHDFGQELGLYYLVMEYVDGVDLARLLRQGLMPVDRSVRIARQLCSALVFAHEREVLHRDIKPANVLVDRDGLVKIADFGLAKLGLVHDHSITLTVPGSTMGTPRYMAPEQWESPDAIDHRADIFAFGMIFYELLTSEVPSGMIDLPSTKAPIDRQADDIVRKCLAQDPDKRYASAQDLEVDLLALEQTTGISRGPRADDSWLRPPPVQLVEEEDGGDGGVEEPEEETAVDLSTGAAPRMRKVQERPSDRFRPRWAWLVGALGLVVCAVVFLTRPNGFAPSSGVQLSTLPALTNGPWWFDDMPFLIPPVRDALGDEVRSHLGFPRTAEEVAALEKDISQVVRELSETTPDTLLRDVVEPLLLTRSVNAAQARSLIPPERAAADPLWKHALANLDHRLGNLTGAVIHYREAIRAYHTSDEMAKHRGLLALCHSDLGRAYFLSGLHEESFESFDRAIKALGEEDVPLFRASCLAGQADACRRFEAWEEAEEALLAAAKALDGADLGAGHPMRTYIHQRLGWLYMDDWKLQDAREAFAAAISSRRLWLEAAGDQSLFIQLRQQHDEMALAMSQRYSGDTDEAIQGYVRVRQRLTEMRQRVNRTPSMQRDWRLRYYNTCERLGDCYLFSETLGPEAARHFQQAAADLHRELADLDPSEAAEFRIQYGRLLAKETVAEVLYDPGMASVQTLRGELKALELGDAYAALLELFAAIAGIIVQAHETSDVPQLLTELDSLVEANKDKQFGRDVREMFLLACRALSPRCQGSDAATLAGVMTRLLPRDPVDPSVLPFLRPHFDRFLSLRLASDELDWSMVRDVHWAKTGSRLEQDWPSRPVVMFYLEAESAYAIGFHSEDETHQLVRVPHGYRDLNALAEHALVTNLIEGMGAAGPFDLYWTDHGYIPPIGVARIPFRVPLGVQVH